MASLSGRQLIGETVFLAAECPLSPPSCSGFTNGARRRMPLGAGETRTHGSTVMAQNIVVMCSVKMDTRKRSLDGLRAVGVKSTTMLI